MTKEEVRKKRNELAETWCNEIYPEREEMKVTYEVAFDACANIFQAEIALDRYIHLQGSAPITLTRLKIAEKALTGIEKYAQSCIDDGAEEAQVHAAEGRHDYEIHGSRMWADVLDALKKIRGHE